MDENTTTVDPQINTTEADTSAGAQETTTTSTTTEAPTTTSTTTQPSAEDTALAEAEAALEGADDQMQTAEERLAEARSLAMSNHAAAQGTLPSEQSSEEQVA